MANDPTKSTPTISAKAPGIWDLEHTSIWKILALMALLGMVFVAAFCLKSIIIDNNTTRWQTHKAQKSTAALTDNQQVQTAVSPDTLHVSSGDSTRTVVMPAIVQNISGASKSNPADVTITTPVKHTTLERFFLYITALGTGLLIAGACYCTGGFLGFLFGIPRYMQHNDIATGNNASKKVISQNDNLVQISDWLTKIIVGVGLTQIYKIPHVINKIGIYLAPSFSGSGYYQPAGRNAAIVTILYFTVLGFLTVYLWTQLFFTKMLEDASEDEDNTNQPAVQVQIGDNANINMPGAPNNP